MIAHGRELLKVNLKLADRGGRVRDVGGNSPDVSGHIMIQLVPQMVGFEVIEDFF
jgi:hypothetical protein